MIFAYTSYMKFDPHSKLKIFWGNDIFNNQDQKYILYGTSAIYFLVFSLALYHLHLGKTILGMFDLVISFTLLLFCIKLWNCKKIHYLNTIIIFLCIITFITTAYLRGGNSILWAYPFVSIIFLLANKNIALIITSLSIAATLPFIVNDLNTDFILSIYPSLLLVSIFHFLIASKTDHQSHNLYELATQDGLTKVLNRHSFNRKVEELIENNTRNNRLVSLLIFDLDKFKNINDIYGHSEGDNVLICFANIIKANIRTSDFLYRYGGEEFVVLTFNTEITDAANLSEYLRTVVENDPLFQRYKLTVSIGVSQIEAQDRARSWLERADTALYKAKTSGRNRVFVATRCKRPGKNSCLSYRVFSALARDKDRNTQEKRCSPKDNKKNVYLFNKHA